MKFRLIENTELSTALVEYFSNADDFDFIVRRHQLDEEQDSVDFYIFVTRKDNPNRAVAVVLDTMHTPLPLGEEDRVYYDPARAVGCRGLNNFLRTEHELKQLGKVIWDRFSREIIGAVAEYGKEKGLFVVNNSNPNILLWNNDQSDYSYVDADAEGDELE